MNPQDKKTTLDDYADIIGLPHPISCRYPQMSMESRAAQFAPFAALNGYKESIETEGRMVESLHIQDKPVNEDPQDGYDY